jgi:hypothetical protein
MGGLIAAQLKQWIPGGADMADAALGTMVPAENLNGARALAGTSTMVELEGGLDTNRQNDVSMQSMQSMAQTQLAQSRSKHGAMHGSVSSAELSVLTDDIRLKNNLIGRLEGEVDR